ncbi:MAG: transcriptional repressor [Candidatus Accumulibacter sp.]|nr:transcriptional repressor [Accumulibacter sp.]
MKETSIIRRLRTARLRPTLARIKVLEMLSENPGFQDVDSIHRWMIEQKIPGCIATIYRSLQILHKADFILCIWDMNGAMRCCFKSEAATPWLRIVCRDDGGGDVNFSDPELHARILSAAAREGLNLEGREFALRVSFARQNPDSGRSASRR